MLTPETSPKFRAGLAAETPLYLEMLKAAQQMGNDHEFRAGVNTFAKHCRTIGELSLPESAALPDVLADLSANLPGHLLWTINKMIREPAERMKIAARAAQLTPKIKLSESSRLRKAAAEFRKNGIMHLKPVLSGEDVKQLASFLKSRTEFDVDGPVKNNLAADAAAAPGALKLAVDPEILALANDHLGGPATIVDIGAWWSQPTPNDDYGAHIFHRDKDDFRACKVFLYLTDVETDDGPHEMVRQAHDPIFIRKYVAEQQADPALVQQLFNKDSRSLAERVPSLFSKNLNEILGPAGTCFLENTFTFHRGKPPRRYERGIFQVTYGMVAYPARLERLAPVTLKALPPDCADTPLARHALRLLLQTA